MSKRKIIILIISIIIIILLVFFYFYFTRKDKTEVESVPDFIYSVFNSAEKKLIESPISDVVDFITGDKEEEEKKINNILNKISSMPITGYGIFKKEVYIEVPDLKPEEKEELNGVNKKIEEPKTEFISVLKYTDKLTGNVYQNELRKLEERRFSNTIIPLIHETFFSKNGMIMRYLKNDSVISTFLAELPKDTLGVDSSNNNEIFGSFLPDNIKDISVSKSGDKIFYLSNTKNGVVGIVSTEKNEEKAQVFDSPFSEWYSAWPNDEAILLTTKPSGIVPGYSYILYPKEKEFEKVLSKIKGLTTLASPDLNKILYSNEKLELYVYNISENTVKTLNIKSLPEKCVWSEDNINIYCGIPKITNSLFLYPDSWYMGEESFNDEVYKINTETNSKNKIVDPSSLYEGEYIDLINLKLDEEEKNLFFMNKRDSYLWGVILK